MSVKTSARKQSQKERKCQGLAAPSSRPGVWPWVGCVTSISLSCIPSITGCWGGEGHPAFCSVYNKHSEATLRHTERRQTPNPAANPVWPYSHPHPNHQQMQPIFPAPGLLPGSHTWIALIAQLVSCFCPSPHHPVQIGSQVEGTF